MLFPPSVFSHGRQRLLQTHAGSWDPFTAGSPGLCTLVFSTFSFLPIQLFRINCIGRFCIYWIMLCFLCSDKNYLTHNQNLNSQNLLFSTGQTLIVSEAYQSKDRLFIWSIKKKKKFFISFWVFFFDLKSKILQIWRAFSGLTNQQGWLMFSAGRLERQLRGWMWRVLWSRDCSLQ